jgi:broad specificity phosphatase PhoE
VWEELVRAVPEGGRVLAISHGRIIEAGAVACLPAAEHAHWGAPFGNCEGLRLVYEHERWAASELLRVDSEAPGDAT